jgi:hypothetical protein
MQSHQSPTETPWPQAPSGDFNRRREGGAALGKEAEGPGQVLPDAQQVRRVRRRALIVVGAVVLVLFFAGLGELAGSFLPHNTPAFANGRTQQAGNLAITVQFAPNPPKVSGTPATQIVASLHGQDGQPLSGAQVVVRLTMLTMDMGSNDTAVQDSGQGTYQARVAFPMPGAWQVELLVTPPGGALVSSTFAVDVSR